MGEKLRVLIPFLLLAACGGGGGNTDPVDQDTAADYCQRGCDRQVECDPTTDVNMCVSNCVDNVSGLIREDVFVDATECEIALSCDATEDTCLEDNCEPTSTHESYEAHCRERLAGCPQIPADSINSACETTPEPGGDTGFLCVIAPSIIDEFDACFDDPDCAGVMSCFQEVAAAHGLDG